MTVPRAVDPERRARALVERTLVRFWPRVDPDGPVPQHAPELGPCWVWTGARNGWGYGVIKYAGEQLAHRVSWRLHVGPLPKGRPLRHRCDNRACVRPAHLLPGSPAENTADMVARGRQRGALGERNGHARLTAAQVAEIRHAFVPRRVTRAMLAVQYGVSISAIKKIVRGTNWRRPKAQPG